MFDDKVVLITGGTGSFGNHLTSYLLRKFKLKKIIIYSRDEYKQGQMFHRFRDHQETMRFFLGDVRDPDRLRIAMKGVDYVFHAAALKQIPACEYNPVEAVKTNILGAMNLIDIAIREKVKKVLAISTDKAVAPANLYGATKLVAEKLFLAANGFGERRTVFSLVRYGNVLSSRGSAVELFREQLKTTGSVKITDKRMTRFWWTLDQAIEFVIVCMTCLQGGETYIPKLRASLVADLISVVAPGVKVETIGIRPGEKLHEQLISKEEERRVEDIGWSFVILPEGNFATNYPVPTGMQGLQYSSDNCLMANPELELIQLLEGAND